MTKEIENFINTNENCNLFLSPALDLMPNPPAGIIMISLQEQKLGEVLLINTKNIASIAGVDMDGKYGKMIQQLKASGFGKPKIEIINTAAKTDGN